MNKKQKRKKKVKNKVYTDMTYMHCIVYNIDGDLCTEINLLTLFFIFSECNEYSGQ